MCGRCVIFTYDEVLDIIMKIEVGVPFGFEPDWPAQRAEAYPNSAATLIIPRFDTAIGVSAAWQEAGAKAEDACHAEVSLKSEGDIESRGSLETCSGVEPIGNFEARDMFWGFEESWKPGVVFNTRIESATKPTWRDSMEHRRCIIPVSSFFETHRDETVASPKTGKPIKRQYEFHVPGQDVILIGATWRGDRFSMVTTEANAYMAPIHHRMPLVIRQEELPLWFGPEYQKLTNRSSIKLESEPA